MARIGKKERLLKYFEDRGSITSFEAFNELFDTRLSDTIYRLEKDGYKFRRETIKKRSYFGEDITFYRYYLEGRDS